LTGCGKAIDREIGVKEIQNQRKRQPKSDPRILRKKDVLPGLRNHQGWGSKGRSGPPRHFNRPVTGPSKCGLFRGWSRIKSGWN
jgi:hypothetical protein